MPWYHTSSSLFPCEGKWTFKIQSSSLQRCLLTPGGMGRDWSASKFGRLLPIAAQQIYFSEKHVDELRCNFIFVLAAVEDTMG